MIGGVGACAGTIVRHRLHRAAGERERRAARAHVRDALHRRPAVPADLAHHLAAVGRLLGLGDARRSSPTSRCRSGRTPTRCPACASRSGAAGSSRSSPGSSRGGRSARPSGIAAAPASRRCRGRTARVVPLGPIEPSPIAEPRADAERRADDRGRPTTRRRASPTREPRPVTAAGSWCSRAATAAGKSTQVGAARRPAARRGRRPCVETFEPGAGAIGAVIRELLLHGPEPVTPVAEALLMAADRAQHVAERDRARARRAATGWCATATCRRRSCTRASSAASASTRSTR